MQRIPAIDGLRGVAVLAVVAYHADLALPGGFAGVDVFFVISGFVITRLIAGEHGEGRFGFRHFYARRIRRILPALLVMLAVVLAAATLLMPPADLRAISQSARWAAAGLSNLYFLQEAGYFDAPDVAWPLLHTWSLGVEEQFYLAYPLFLVLALRFLRQRAWIAIVLAALVSGATALALHATYREAMAFYLPFSRAWQLMLGAALVFIPSPGFRTGAGLAGLALVAGAFLTTAPSPWPQQVMGSFGAALLIWGREGMVGRWLSARPLLAVGLISYSLYLWHMPLLTFNRVLGLGYGVLPTLAAIAASFGAAWLSWRYIETPVQTTRRGGAAVRVTLASALVLGLAASGIILARGLPDRYPAALQAILDPSQADRMRSQRLGRCFLQGETSDLAPECLMRREDRPDWLLIGDSHGAHLWSGLSGAAPDVNLMQATRAGCRMTLRTGPREHPACKRLIRQTFEDIARNPPDLLILAGRWTPPDPPAIRHTLQWAKARGIRVVLVGPVPRYWIGQPRLVAMAERFGRPDLVSRQLEPDVFPTDKALAELAAAEGAPYVSLTSLLCTPDCATRLDHDTLLLADRAHLTPAGSALVGAGVIGRLRAAAAQPALTSERTATSPPL